jgi:hypothetical protein
MWNRDNRADRYEGCSTLDKLKSSFYEVNMTKYRVARFYKGKFGYPERYEYCQIQAWNSIYKRWYSIDTGHLGIEFVKDTCLIKKLDFESMPHVYIKKEDDIK